MSNDSEVRVYEVAKQYGVPARDVLMVLQRASLPASTASSKLSSAQVEAVRRELAAAPGSALAVTMPSMGRIVRSQPRAESGHGQDPAGARQEDEVQGVTGFWADIAPPTDDSTLTGGDSEFLRALILRAFEAARIRGKEDWRVMSTAVLKNRMSQLLQKKFDQRQYGYSRITDVVKDFPDLLALDESKNPPTVLLLSEPAPVPVDESVQVRPDLWRGVVDYERREPYVLVNGQALPRSLAPEDAQQLPTLPTINPEVLDFWRRDFAASARGILQDRPEQLERLNLWVESHEGTSGLPGVLRGRWNLYLKNAVIKRLNSWFEREGIPVPSDVTIPSTRVRRPELAIQRTEESLLRQALLEVISRMSFEELRQVYVPSISLIRRGS